MDAGYDVKCQLVRGRGHALLSPTIALHLVIPFVRVSRPNL